MRYVLLTILLSISFNTQAKVNPIEHCSHFEEYARIIMEHRQNNLPMKTMMEEIDRRDPDNKYPVYKDLLIEAYEQTSYITDKSKQRAINEFSNNIYLDCIKLMR